MWVAGAVRRTKEGVVRRVGSSLKQSEGSTVAAEGGEPWSQQTRDRWFFGALAVSTAAVAYLFSPFLYVLLFASVVVVVAWPLFERILARCGGRRGLAAVLTVGVLAIVL